MGNVLQPRGVAPFRDSGMSLLMMQVNYSPEGIYLAEIDLWLDPRRNTPAAWISHAHSDHARGSHATVFCTTVTREIYQVRAGEAAVKETRFVALDYGQQAEWNGARLTSLAAGHILGAAQLLVEYRDERLLYTGDIKLRPPLCGHPTEQSPCDHLIMECTFGLPVFHFLSREEGAEQMVAFARECLAEGDTPAFLGYPLGRGQEVAHVLATAGIPTALHGAIARYLPWYEQAGYGFGDWAPYDRRDVTGRALVVTPSFRSTLQAAGKNVRIAYVSGWASMDNARARTGAEALIPYSDHADFRELLALAGESGAQRVDVVHGYTETFARILRDRGIEATAPLALAERSVEEEAAE